MDFDEFDQDTWPACEHCGRVQVHRSGCPAITVAVGGLAGEHGVDPNLLADTIDLLAVGAVMRAVLADEGDDQ